MKTVLAPGAPWPVWEQPKPKPEPKPRGRPKAKSKPKGRPKGKKSFADPVCFIHLPIKTMKFCKEDLEFFASLKDKK